ncbi:MAG TPA: winged helix-turn-helix domain-containing protein, partial [Candidatus Dormibacteraeota bacterium]|nr:winged helix-turn-helix domain-containing protein [Candidatus Dormibacteraeota bacterium]
VLSRGGVLLDPARRHVTLNGRLLNVTTAEFHILELLMRRFPAVVERKAIAEHAWRDETEPLGSNVIDVKMSRLRAKLVNAGVRIVTVRGSGFRLEEA